MTFTLQRLPAPALSALAAAAVSLAAPVAAHAALGGAVPLTSTARPDLRSATVTTAANAGSSSGVRICFDKALDGAAAPASVVLGTYDRAELAASAVAPGPAMCIDATFPKTSLDPYTYVTVAAGAVSSGGNPAVADSTALIGGATSSGTTGKTTGPDLVGVQTVSDTLARFTFDENVASAEATGFHVDQASGVDIVGMGTATINKNVVTVPFAGGVANAVRGYAESGVARGTPGDSAGRGQGNPLLAVPVAGGTLTTSDPDVSTATLAPDGSYVDFVYDEPVKITAPVVRGTFTVTRSDGNLIQLTGQAVLNDGVTVRASVPDGESQNEYLVVASAALAAVTSQDGGRRFGSAAGLGIGSNKGASATGFTTAPDALSVALDPAAGTVRVLLDQRFFSSSAGRVVLLDAAGDTLGSATASGIGGGPGRVTATATFSPQAVAAARAVQLMPNALAAFGVGSPSSPVSNPVQALAPRAP